jgi:hypothetical protein
MLLTSCGNSEPKPISAKAIVKEVNQSLVDDAEAEEFTEVAVGTYECNDPMARNLLAKLEVAGLVDYEVTRYAWWEKSTKSYKKAYTVTRGYGWWSYQDTEYKWVKGTSYDFEDHYVVTVSLTRKGERLVVDELPQPKENVDEDMISKEIDPSSYKWNQVNLDEDWEYIPNPFLEKKEPKEEETNTTKAEPRKETRRQPKESTKEPEKDPVVRIDSLKYEAYVNFDENRQKKYLKVGEIKAVKARNIQILEGPDGLTAQAEVVLETENATDAGRILEGFENGQKSLVNVSFTYYTDKGWVLTSVSK